MSQQSNAKPSLQGVRIKARKRTVKASAKHEPEAFRDQLYKHLETVPENEFDTFSSKLITAGSTLEYLKYADALFEILIVGGLLQPGGNFVDDGAPPSPFAVANAKEPVQIEEIEKYVDVFNKLIRRYKYLQKPLEETTLPTLMQYLHKFKPEQQEKMSAATALLIAQGLASASCLQSLTKDHLVKDGLSLRIITQVIRTYLVSQSLDHLSGSLRKGGVKDLMNFFPANQRDVKSVQAHFKEAGLPQIGDWYSKKQDAVVKSSIIKQIQEMCEADENTDDVVAYIKGKQAEQPLAEADLVQTIWQGLMASIDWNARPDQIESLAVREIGKYAPILEPFCNSGKTQVALINTVQVYCYEDTRVIKTFLQILKVLYNKDVLSDQAIIYWYQKGAKPQGKQHFLKATEQLVTFLQNQEESEEDDE